MKISDPIGKVYQHSMFKKKSYNIPKGTRIFLNNKMISPSNVQVVTVISWTTPEISAMRMMRVATYPTSRTTLCPPSRPEW